MAQEKQVPLPISLLGVPVGFAGYEPKASPWVTSLLCPWRWTLSQQLVRLVVPGALMRGSGLNQRCQP